MGRKGRCGHDGGESAEKTGYNGQCCTWAATERAYHAEYMLCSTVLSDLDRALRRRIAVHIQRVAGQAICDSLIVCRALRFGTLNVGLLKKALKRLSARLEAVPAAFATLGGKPLQQARALDEPRPEQGDDSEQPPLRVRAWVGPRRGHGCAATPLAALGRFQLQEHFSRAFCHVLADAASDDDRSAHRYQDIGDALAAFEHHQDRKRSDETFVALFKQLLSDGAISLREEYLYAITIAMDPKP